MPEYIKPDFDTECISRIFFNLLVLLDKKDEINEHSNLFEAVFLKRLILK